jgi:hypothetical protein
MGGDGGVIASNRKYMRGAGTANHTADGASSKQQQEASAKEVQQELMSVCYLTKAPLNFKKQQIVADPYGRLYNKEAAVEALLRRKTSSDEVVNELGSHIRGLKDLVTLNVELSSSNDNDAIPICPVTSVELNGVNPAVLLPHVKDGGVNVLAERSIKEMGKEALREEYGDLDHVIRLAPPPRMMEEIIKKVQEQHDLEKAAKLAKKKKRNKSGDDDEEARKKKKKKLQAVNKKSSTVTDAARQRMKSAVESNHVLSSLFATKKNISEKERGDSLFAR